jgi:hypothetical protein
MTRTVSLLLAVLLTVLQPALAMCQCAGCSGGCAQPHAAQAANNQAANNQAANNQAASKSCCGAKAHGTQSACCGGSTANCPCRSAAHHSASNSKSNAKAAPPGCFCSAQPQLTAVPTNAVQVDHSAGSHFAFLALAPPTDMGLVRAPAILARADRGPPGCYGGLRIHAFLGVWLI